MILRIAHLSILVKYTVISGVEKCVKIQHLTRSLRKHLLLIQLLHQRLHHFIPMLTKVLIQRIGRTFGQHHNLNAPLPALCGFWHPATSGPPLRLPASLYLPAFRPLPAPDEPKARDRPKGSSCCRYCFVGHRIGMPGNNNFVIERVEHRASSTSSVLKNGIIFALPRSNILRFWSSLISTRNPWEQSPSPDSLPYAHHGRWY